MKLEKGLTLSQFVDYIKSKIGINTEIVGYEYIIIYNDFLKQPLTKGQFIPCDEDGNELEEFNASKHGLKSGEYYKKWKASEKKVIFKGWSYRKAPNCYVLSNTKHTIYVYGKSFLLNDMDFCKTIADLFNAINGELITQKHRDMKTLSIIYEYIKRPFIYLGAVFYFLWWLVWDNNFKI